MEQVDYEEPLALYRNDNALSIGFLVDSDIKDQVCCFHLILRKIKNRL